MLRKIVAFIKKVFSKKKAAPEKWESENDKRMRELREKYWTGYKVLNINQWTGKYNDIY